MVPKAASYLIDTVRDEDAGEVAGSRGVQRAEGERCELTPD
jgi:hypothetical protein